jgi:choline kinase
MKCIILAAGLGRRLGQDLPKCLLKFNGKTLLERHIDNLRAGGIDEILIVVGYEAQAICDEIKVLGADQVSTVYNPDYEQGSVLSLWHAREYLGCGQDMLLMDGDVMYHPHILERLVKTDVPNCFLLDRDFEMGEEPVKLCVREGVLVEFRKQLAADLTYDFAGESVGFFKFNSGLARSLAACTEEYITTGRRTEPYEEAIRDLLLESPTVFGYEDITGLAWVEIDFPQDIQRAQTQILPKIGEW